MHALIATTSVHTTAAACDWLESRLDESDRVTVVTILDGDVSERIAAEAANVARVRLPTVTVDSLTISGAPAQLIREVASGKHDPEKCDILLMGPRRGEPGMTNETPGSTTQQLIASPPVPVLVVPA